LETNYKQNIPALEGCRPHRSIDGEIWHLFTDSLWNFGTGVKDVTNLARRVKELGPDGPGCEHPTGGKKHTTREILAVGVAQTGAPWPTLGPLAQPADFAHIHQNTAQPLGKRQIGNPSGDLALRDSVLGQRHSGL